MTRTFSRCGSLWLAVILLTAAPASAQVVHSLHFGVGGFFPTGFDGRSDEDVLLRNAAGEPFVFDPTLSDALLFEMKDFRSAYLFGEWNAAVTERVEVGASLGFSRKTVPTIYLDVVDDVTDEDLRQELRLRIIPITALVRFLPFGTPSTIQPYVGGGVSALPFSYSEEGEFVDSFSAEIFNARYRASGMAFGGVLFGGVRIPVNGDVFAVTLELRRQFGRGDLGTDLEDADEENDFLADKIDLGGTQFTGGLLIRF